MKNTTSDIIYKKNTSITTDKLTGLYSSVDWSGYTDHPEKMKKLLPGSLYYISAWHDEKLIGLIRAVGDGASILYVQDILVHPDYQRKKVGTQLMHELIDDNRDIRQLLLLTDQTEKTESFYASLGFTPVDRIGAVAFIRMNTQK